MPSYLLSRMVGVVFCILLWQGISSDIHAQRLKGFSTKRMEFLDDVRDFLSTSRLIRSNMYGDFFRFYIDLQDEESRQLTIEAFNVMYKRNIREPVLFQSFMTSIVRMSFRQKKDPTKVKAFLRNTIKYVSTHTYDYNLKLLTLLEQFYRDQIFERNPNFTWKYEFGNALFEVDTVFRFKFNGPVISCYRYKDTLLFREAVGSYYPEERRIHIESATILWRNGVVKRVRNQNLETSELYATGFDFDINTLRTHVVVPKAYLYNSVFLDGEAEGRLELKPDPSMRDEVTSPLFETDRKDYTFDGREDSPLGADVDFFGGFYYQGFKLFGVGDGIRRAELTIKNEGKPYFKIRSNRIQMSPAQILAPEATTTIYLKDDSMYHQQVSVTYFVPQRYLAINQNLKADSKTPYLNQHNFIDMFVQSMSWDSTATDTVRFKTNPLKVTPIVSGGYYERGMIEEFRGVTNKNPLIKIVQLFHLLDGDEETKEENMNFMPILDLATALSIDTISATHILMRMSESGFAFIELDKSRFRFTPRLLQKVQAYRDQIDFDQIMFVGRQDTSMDGSINPIEGTIQMDGVKEVIIDEKKQMSIFPEGERVTIKDSMNFAFDGSVEVGNFEFRGAEYDFGYDDYTLDMNGNQSMYVSVPSFEKNAFGQSYLRRVRNSIDSLVGTLYIDEPENKSGKVPKPEYPTFTSTENAYVYYNHKEIYDSAYTAERFHYIVYPFTLDSMNLITTDNLIFDGEMNSGNIFPDFEEQIFVQRDYAYGFVRYTPVDGFEAYGGKGQYYDEISLNYSGLTGNGKLEYLTSTSQSEDMTFFLDSSQFFNTDFVMEEDVSVLDAPSLHTPQAEVYWTPYKDSMVIVSNKSFTMYDSTLTNDGRLILTPEYLKGSAKINMPTAYMESDEVQFKAKNFVSEDMQVKFREKMGAPFELEVEGAYGDVNLENNKGEFKLRDTTGDGNPAVVLPVSRYRAYVNKIDWDITEKTFDMSNEPFEDSVRTAETPWFVSTDDNRDSLRFQGKSATYSLEYKNMQAKEVEYVETGDTRVYPDSGLVTILRGGNMNKLKNADVVIKKGPYEYHRLKQSEVNINKRDDYGAKGTYTYYDRDSVEQYIDFKKMSYDTTQKTSLGYGDILEEQNFQFDPYFKYKGNVELIGRERYLKYRGYTSIESQCEGVETGTIPINTFVNPNKIRLKVNEFEGVNVNTVYSGVYQENPGEFSVAFASNKPSSKEKRLSDTYGSVYFDEGISAYVIEDNASIDDLLRAEYYEDQCKFINQSKFHIQPKNKLITANAFGKITSDMNSDEITMELALGLKFFFPKTQLFPIFQDLRYSEGDELLSYSLSNKIALNYLDPDELKKVNEAARHDSIMEENRKALETAEQLLGQNTQTDSLQTISVEQNIYETTERRKYLDSIEILRYGLALRDSISLFMQQQEEQRIEAQGRPSQDSIIAVLDQQRITRLRRKVDDSLAFAASIRNATDSILKELNTERDSIFARQTFVRDSLSTLQKNMIDILRKEVIKKAQDAKRVIPIKPKLRHDLYLHDLKMKWDPDLKTFYTKRDIGVWQVDFKPIEKVVRGVVELDYSKEREGVVIRVMLDSDQGFSYFFEFSKNVKFFTDNSRHMATMKRIDVDDLTYETENGDLISVDFMNESALRNFKRKY